MGFVICYCTSFFPWSSRVPLCDCVRLSLPRLPIVYQARPRAAQSEVCLFSLCVGGLDLLLYCVLSGLIFQNNCWRKIFEFDRRSNRLGGRGLLCPVNWTCRCQNYTQSWTPAGPLGIDKIKITVIYTDLKIKNWFKNRKIEFRYWVLNSSFQIHLLKGINFWISERFVEKRWCSFFLVIQISIIPIYTTQNIVLRIKSQRLVWALFLPTYKNIQL